MPRSKLPAWLSIATFAFACQSQPSQAPNNEPASSATPRAVSFGERGAVSDTRIASSSSFEFSRSGNVFRKTTSSLVVAVKNLDEGRKSVTIETLERKDWPKGAEPQESSIKQVEALVDQSSGQVVRTDGKPIEDVDAQLVSNAVGNPLTRALRTKLLTNNTLPIGDWREIPAATFNHTSYKQRGFERARFRVLRVTHGLADWHLEATGQIGQVDLHETLTVDSLRGCKGKSLGSITKQLGGEPTEIKFSATYEATGGGCQR